MNFDDWTDEVFWPWLAGFFDGEGCIYLPKNGVGAELTIANTDRPVIEAIFRRTRVGIISSTEFANQPDWKTKYVWRVRNYPHAGLILRALRPFLVIKGAKADEALARIESRLAVRTKKHERNMAVIDAVEAGLSRREIAERHGVTRSFVDWIVRNGRSRDPSLPAKDCADPSVIRRGSCRSKKEKVHVETSSERVAGALHREKTARRLRTERSR